MSDSLYVDKNTIIEKLNVEESPDELDRKIFNLKKRLYVNSRLQKDAIGYRKKINENARRRRKERTLEDPGWKLKQNEEQRKRYHKNPKPQIESSTKWNKENKEQRNKTRRLHYAKNKEMINLKKRFKRLVIRFEKSGFGENAHA